MIHKPLISIIMPTYNREHLLPNTITSVIKQTYENWELLIVDDFSRDNTKKLINSFSQNDERIKYILNDGSKGVSSARNKGILSCKGEYIAFLDSDDFWTENHLFDCLKVLLEKNICVCFALWTEMDREGNCYKMFSSNSENNKFKKAIMELNAEVYGNTIIFSNPDFFEYTILKSFYCYHINTMVISKKVIEKVGMFNKKLLASEDEDFTLRVLYEYKFCLILDYHFIYMQGEDNLHNFLDRRNANLDKLLKDKDKINKLTFCGLNKCKAIKLRKKLIKKSLLIKEKKLCIYACNKKLGLKFFTLGYINKELYKTKAIFFLLKAAFYRNVNLKFIINTLFPFLFKDYNNIKLKDLKL